MSESTETSGHGSDSKEYQKTKICKSASDDTLWEFGQGATDGRGSLHKRHLGIDPSGPEWSARKNYKLLTSGISPRPIGFVGTRNEDSCTENLAPFSYTQVVSHDPPVFVIGFVGATDKDTLLNLKRTGECVINIVSEHFLEAANATSINAPYGVSEWEYSGLTRAPCTVVNVSRVKESLFSIEGKLLETKDFESRFHKGMKSGCMALIEGIRFWVREDALTSGGDEFDISVLRPVSRLGGRLYSKVGKLIEMSRPVYETVATNTVQ